MSRMLRGSTWRGRLARNRCLSAPAWHGHLARGRRSAPQASRPPPPTHTPPSLSSPGNHGLEARATPER
ncbi:MAG: hypothetical protein LBK99_22495 [Opitutaceae bacterium]|nr:hypothetical protein [Opitutaceae bacterium]